MWKLFRKNLTPSQLLSLGFIIIIIAGTILLSLPISSSNHTYQNTIDALFTSTSALTTTGLIVVDTGTYYNFFGQIVILTLIQIGGLGYMVFIVVIFMRFKNKLSLSGKKFLRESLSRTSKIDMIKFVKVILLFTLIIELIGAIIYFLYWLKYFTFGDALYQAVFHSISAFCTAGFSLFSDSFTKYGQSVIINLNTNFLVLTGAVGFFVLYDVYLLIIGLIKGDPLIKLSLHSKTVLWTTLFLFISGAIVIYFAEGNKFSDNNFINTLYALFQSISGSSTVGFNTVDIGLMAPASLFVIIILMFIGGSPGSTAGGIKTTAFASIVFSALAILKGNDVIIFKRRLNPSIINNVIALIFVAVTSVTIGVFILTITEKFSLMKILFEAVSAFGTVGLSTGITSQLSVAGKLVIILLMLIGRIGPLSVGISLMGKQKQKDYKHPEEDILVA